VLALYASNLKYPKGKKHIFTLHTSTEIGISGPWAYTSNDDLNTGVDERACKTGFFTYNSFISF
jgi:hypothetical protein